MVSIFSSSIVFGFASKRSQSSIASSIWLLWAVKWRLSLAAQ